MREGQIVLRAEETGSGTMAAKIIRMILDAPIHETRVQQYAGRFADRFGPGAFSAPLGIFCLRGAAGRPPRC